MSNKNLKISLAQLNFTVGDLEGNYKKISAAHKSAHSEDADLLVFCELAITGYPPEDLIMRPDFQQKSIDLVRKLALLTKNAPAILIGAPWREGTHLYNAAILLDNGSISHISCKSNLPNYGVFDEKRLFATAPLPKPIMFKGVQLGILICEEMWDDTISLHLKNLGAQLLICINASPFEIEKHNIRLKIARQNIQITNLPLIYVNLVGGQDELVFDGNSFILAASGELLLNLPAFAEELSTTSWQYSDNTMACTSRNTFVTPEKYANIYAALTLGLKDYVQKNGFHGVVIGMSGGIDSAISAAIAVAALGKDNVLLIMMPSKYTAKTSLKDAKDCAKLLGAKLENISIKKIVSSFANTMQGIFNNTNVGGGITEENLQSRIRGDILMAISNKFGHMVLTTGNKSEIAVGYATLYGDMCGGFNILKDIYKTDVFALCKWLNLQKKTIPENIISKAPSAELKPNQTDQDTLPPYDMLDKILYKLIELQQSAEDIIHSGFAPEIVTKTAKMVKFSEYKRRQAAPGIKITHIAFGRDRRYPITNGFEF